MTSYEVQYWDHFGQSWRRARSVSKRQVEPAWAEITMTYPRHEWRIVRLTLKVLRHEVPPAQARP